MAINRIHINPEILKSAIVRAGKRIEDCINIDPDLSNWLDNRKMPTFKQLENFSRKYHIPFGYLFLESLPIEETPIPVFRKGKDANYFDLNVYDTVLIMQKRQEWLSEYLEENEFDPLPFVSAYKNKDVNEVVNALYALLGLERNWAENKADYSKALNVLTERIENNGIIVSFSSVVGNNSHRKIEVEECRGFALVNIYAPFIFVNSGDSKAAQIFTIIHEMAHVLVGFSAGYGIENISRSQNYYEQFCDKVAAEFLLPIDLFKEDWKIKPMLYLDIARKYKVSTLVVARRALECNLITKKDFLLFYRSYKTNIQLNARISRGGEFYRSAIKRISRTFAIHVNNAVKSNRLLYRDAYKLTGLQGRTFNNLFQLHLGQ